MPEHPITGNQQPECWEHGTRWAEGCESCTLCFVVWSGGVRQSGGVRETIDG